MTRKDFQLIADVLKNNDPGEEVVSGSFVHRKIARDMVDVLEANNERFNRQKFNEAVWEKDK